MKKPILILLPLLLSGSLAFGSGGGSGGGSGSSGGSSGGTGGAGGSNYSSAPSANYDIGKRVFFRKLYCASCPLSGLALDRGSVASIMPSLDSDGDLGNALSYRERYAVRYFLKRRFNL